MTQFFRVAIIIMALFSSPIAHAGSCLWFADHNFLHQVQTDTNQISQNVLLKEPLGLAMNATDCGVWTLAERALHKYAANGNLAQQIDLNSLLPKVENVRQIAVDPYDNSVWFITENQFYHISASGLLIGSWKAAGSVRRFSLGLDQSLWAIGSKQLWHYDIQGNLLATVNLDGVVKNEPKLLAVDGLGGVLWIAGEKQLIQFSLKVPHPLVLNIALLQPVKDLTLDPSSGTIWLTAEKSLVAYARDGSPLPNIDFTILGIKDIQTLAFDPPSQSLWIGDKSGITRITTAGVVIAKLPALDGPLLIATPPFVVSPILTGTSINPV